MPSKPKYIYSIFLHCSVICLYFLCLVNQLYTDKPLHVSSRKDSRVNKLHILVDIFCSMRYGNIPWSIKEVHRQGSRQLLLLIRGDADLRQWAVYGTASVSRRGKMTSVTFFMSVIKKKKKDIVCVANNSPKPVFIPLKGFCSSFSSHLLFSVNYSP